MARRQKEEMQDEVQKDEILRELYLKELRTQKLYTQYHVNPLRKGEGRRGVEEGERGRSEKEEPPRVLDWEAGLGQSTGDAVSDLAPLPRRQKLRLSAEEGGAVSRGRLSPHITSNILDTFKYTQVAIKIFLL